MVAQDVLFAFTVCLLAGLSTGLGSLLSLWSKRFDKRFLAGALGFSAGVMVYVSMIEIVNKARAALVPAYGIRLGSYLTVIAFFLGIGIIAVIDKLIPSIEQEHEPDTVTHSPQQQKKLMRLGLFTALALAIHNFPEGLATFLSALSDPALGASIAIAIAIHNIPEGIAVSSPIYYATGNRKKAFWYSFLSGLAEPVGALFGYYVVLRFLPADIFGFVFAAVAGIMVYISFDELLPTAEQLGQHDTAMLGLVSGMFIMAMSLLLFI
ncbi:MAG TPA: zinc transporter ZupT [bacterium]|nr:zinc transporter ZupT [bacterium]